MFFIDLDLVPLSAKQKNSMRKFILITVLIMAAVNGFAQKDSTPFRAYLYNNEYEVYLRINLHDQNITIPGQELYGELPGYLGKKNNSFCWVITSAKIKDKKTATMNLINDYGSEDLTATLTRKNDSIYILKQESGSTLKVPKNSKWQKIPKTIELKRRK
jgi:hypothetical protein